MQCIDSCSLWLGDDLQLLAHAGVLCARASLGLSHIGPYCGDCNDVLDGCAFQDALRELMLEHRLGMGTYGGEIVCTELLGGDIIARGKSVLIRKVAAQVGDTTRLGGIKVELEPLMTRAIVVDLETPPRGVVLISDFAKNMSVFNSANEGEEEMFQLT